MWLALAVSMNLTIGGRLATAMMTDHGRHTTSPPTSSATKTWTTTVLGAMTQLTGMFGLPVSPPDGRLITMVIGPGFLRGAGPGLTTLLGVTHRFTTAVGYLPAVTGAGCLGRSRSNLCTRRRL